MPSSRIVAAMLLWLACAGTVAAVPVLRVLSWPGYADADVVARFEAEHKVRVEISLVESDDQLWQRLTDDSGGRFDLLDPLQRAPAQQMPAHTGPPMEQPAARR